MSKRKKREEKWYRMRGQYNNINLTIIMAYWGWATCDLHLSHMGRISLKCRPNVVQKTQFLCSSLLRAFKEWLTKKKKNAPIMRILRNAHLLILMNIYEKMQSLSLQAYDHIYCSGFRCNTLSNIRFFLFFFCVFRNTHMLLKTTHF